MKITVAKNDLEQALRIVASTLGSSGGDITSHFIFRTTLEGRIEILTNKNTVYCSTVLRAATVEGEGTFTVEGKRLQKWLSAVNDTETITFVFSEDKSVQCTESRGKQKFASLDPATFPYWDRTLSESTVAAKLPASRLRDALTHAKRFVSDRENKYPHLCIIEFQSGSLKACDAAAFTAIQMEDMEKLDCRFHGKNVGNVIKFLDQFGDSPVEVLIHDRVYFLRSGDTVLGETKFTAKLPVLSVDWEEEAHYAYTMDRDDLSRGIKWLQAGADANDEKLFLKTDSETNKLHMRMKTAVGGELVDHEISCIEIQQGDDVEALPESGVAIPCSYLNSALIDHSESSVKIELIPKPERKAGIIRVFDRRNGDQYATFVGWLRR